MRYIAVGFDLGVVTLFEAENAQELADKVYDHIVKDRGPNLLYTQDTNPDATFPFTAWTLGNGNISGTACKNLKEVLAAIDRR